MKAAVVSCKNNRLAHFLA